MRTITKSSIVAAAFVGLCAGSARAEQAIEVKVPFSFVMQGREFPAGPYEVLTDLPDGVVSVRSADNRTGNFAFTVPLDGRDPAGSKPTLVFMHYENGYRLSQIWEADSEGRALIEAPSHRRAGRVQAQAQPVETLAYVVEGTWQKAN